MFSCHERLCRNPTVVPQTFRHHGYRFCKRGWKLAGENHRAGFDGSWWSRDVKSTGDVHCLHRNVRSSYNHGTRDVKPLWRRTASAADQREAVVAANFITACPSFVAFHLDSVQTIMHFNGNLHYSRGSMFAVHLGTTRAKFNRNFRHLDMLPQTKQDAQGNGLSGWPLLLD